MKVSNLIAEIARCGLTIPKLALLMGVDKKTLYAKIKGNSSFKQNEIANIMHILNLSPSDVYDIFFSE